MKETAFPFGTVAEVLPALKAALAAPAGRDAGLEARMLLAHALRCPIGALPTMQDRTLTQVEAAFLLEACTRRMAREPLQYILGEWEFMGLPFKVRPGALIPRPDTETLTEEALRLAVVHGYTTALDLCCGTGCIGITLAKLGGLAVTLADISPEAIALSRENAQQNSVQAQFALGSWFSPIHQKYDMIVCNPPYLTAAELRALQPEVAYEPTLALDGGADGLDAYRSIRAAYQAFLAPGGKLLLEVGAGQAQDVAALFDAERILPDLNGVERVIVV